MFQTIINFIAYHIFIIHKGVISAKIKSSLILGTTASPIAILLEKITDWYMTNMLTIWLITGAVLADWIVGIIKHLICKTFSWKENGKGLLIKTSMIVIGGFLAESLPHFLGGNDNLFTTGLVMALRLSVFMYPAASCWANMAIVTNGKFPPVGLMNRIKSFNENLNVKELTDGKQS